MAALLAVSFVLLLVRYERRMDYSWKQTLRLAIVLAVLMFVNPPLGLPAYLCAVVSVLTQQRPAIWFRTGVIAATALVVIFTPWVIRNEQA